MLLKSLLLRNFRSYTSFEISFSPHTNVISGGNAEGKTNLLEAIHLISTGRSFRTLNLKELIKHKSSYFYLEAEFEKNSYKETVKIYYDGSRKKIIHNSNNYASFSSLLGLSPLVIHTPDDLHLIKGGPKLRRKFLNLHLAQKDPLYVHHYLRYLKALKQRNALLKKNIPNLLRPFEVELAKSGAYLTLARNKFINEIQKPISDKIKKISNLNISTQIKYQSSIQIQDELSNTIERFLMDLEKNRKKDLIFKSTLIGPHRDDFSIFIDENTAKHFASEGQKKILLYALSFVQWRILEKKLNIKPLLLIDDFDAHLDDNHKNKIKKMLQNFSQVFVTIPSNSENFENSKTFNIKKDVL